MPFLSRLRWPGTRKAGAAALTVALAVLFTACASHPESIFHRRTDFNRDTDFLFKILIYLGTAVFIFVETILVWTLIKFRKRPNQKAPDTHVHGNTALEVTWTIVPALILILIAIPTVRTIFKTQAAARSDALQVEVIGHQWWWEFRYPQYGIITANELYLPIGRTVNFTLKTQDVLHSFWIPALGGKRDLIANHTNYLWFTPDSTSDGVFNGQCAEYCGTSHANMRFKAFTVTPAEFASWAANQAAPAVGTTPGATQAAVEASVAQNPNLAQSVAPAGARVKSTMNGGANPNIGSGPTAPSTGPAGVGVPASAPAANVQQAGFTMYPLDKIPAYARPETPLPAAVTFDDALLAKGDAANGAKLMIGAGTCLACHTIKGNPMMSFGTVGPNLTHLASRTTIGAGLYPNDARHLARWIKNARILKPGAIMTTLGIGQYDPQGKDTTKAGLTDQQIADIVAYLETLK
jgi:cytochrome c oxidase subunit 2